MVFMDKLIELEELWKNSRNTKKKALDAERDYRTEKARLRLETDWSKHFDKKPTDKDKEAFITFETMPLKELADDLKLEADYQWELWELQKILLKKGGCHHD